MSNLLVIQELQNNLRNKPSAANERPLGKKRRRPGAHLASQGGNVHSCAEPRRRQGCPSCCKEAWPLGAQAGLCGQVSAGTWTRADGRPWIFVGPLIAQPLEAAGDV